MSRVLAWSLLIGLTLLAGGLFASVVAPSFGAALLVLAAFIVLGGALIVALAMARQTPGWTRVWNPGAARRDYDDERAAKGRNLEPGHGNRDKRER
jgi:hypothetical protein